MKFIFKLPSTVRFVLFSPVYVPFNKYMFAGVFVAFTILIAFAIVLNGALSVPILVSRPLFDT